MIQKLKTQIFELIFKKILESKIESDFKPNNYLFFKNIDEINIWAIEFNDFFKSKKEQIGRYKLSESEEYEIETYEYYAGYVGEKMNGLLRKNRTILFPDLIEKRINALSNSLSKFKLKDNLIVIRRFPKKKFIRRLKKGDIFIEKGFISTSLNLFSRLGNESEFKPINNEVLMILKVPKNTNACYIEQISNRKEYELIIQKNEEIVIEQNIWIFNNRIIIGKIKKPTSNNNGNCYTTQ